MNPIQQNNNNKKDKIDKTPEDSGEQIKHNILTKELIRRNYISDDDVEKLDLVKEKDDFER